MAGRNNRAAEAKGRFRRKTKEFKGKDKGKYYTTEVVFQKEISCFSKVITLE